MAKKNHSPLTDTQKAKVKEIVAKNALRNGRLRDAVAIIDSVLGVTLSISQLSRYLKKERQTWSKNAQNAITQAKAKELAKLDQLEREVYIQWDKSTQDSETIIDKETRFGDFQTKKVSGQSGNPRYIDALVAISKRRAELLGLDAPTKQETTITLEKDIEDMTDEELCQLEQALDSESTDQA